MLTVAKLLPLLPLAVAGLWLAGWQSPPTAAPTGPAALGQALLLTLFACFGFEQAAVVAGEMRDPRRDLPVGVLGGVAITAAAVSLYQTVAPTCVGVAPPTSSTRVAEIESPDV